MAMNSLPSVNASILAFERETSSKFVILQKSKSFGKDWKNTIKKKPPVIYWQAQKGLTAPEIPYDGTPYVHLGRLVLVCHLGKDYGKKKKEDYKKKTEKKMKEDHVIIKRRKMFQTKKQNCRAQIYVSQVVRFPGFKITESTTWKRAEASKRLRDSLSGASEIEGVVQYYMQFPSGHCNHPITGQDRLSKQMEHNISGPELQNDVEDMIYLDYNATTPLEDEVIETISRTLREAWQNPSSSYATDTSGKSVKQIIDEARQNVADMIGGNIQDIVFTSGGTESNNMVFHTMLSHFEFKYNKTALERQTEGHDISVQPDKKIPHFITSNIEHDSIKIVLQEYQTLRKAEVTFVPVSKDTGQIVPEDVIAAIKPNTVLVSVMLANNETGILQPIAEISERLRTIKRGDGETSRIFLHTDAAQALGKIPVSVQDLRVDYLTIVGHKFYGPRIGALYFPGRAGTAPLYPMFYGGGQERNYRPGTENTPMIAGLGKAAELVSRNVKVYGDHMEKTRNYLETQLETTFPDRVKFNGRYPKVPRLPNTCNVSILGAKLHGFQVLSKLKYVQTSVGAACHAQNRPSHILLASGVDPTAAANALRLSVGRHTTKDDIDRAIVDLKQAVQALESDIGQ